MKRRSKQSPRAKTPFTWDEDEVRSHVEEWAEEAKENGQWVHEAMEKGWISLDKTQLRKYMEHFQWHRDLSGQLLEAIDRKEFWLAIETALLLGVAQRTILLLTQMHIDRPAVIRGQKNIKATTDGANAVRKLPPGQLLLAELSKLELSKPGQKKRWYQAEIAKRYEATDSAVRKAIKKPR